MDHHTTEQNVLDREITQLVIRIDSLRNHSNRSILSAKLESLIIREAFSSALLHCDAQGAWYAGRMLACPSITDWISAVSGLSATVIAGISLSFLIKYVGATQKQVVVSQDQLEGVIRPILVVTQESINNKMSIGIRNVSASPALNLIYYTYGLPDPPQAQRIPVLVQETLLSGGNLQHFILFKHGMGEDAAFDVEYESASGQRYRSRGQWSRKSLELSLSITKL
jgi:hypothetical protein